MPIREQVAMGLRIKVGGVVLSLVLTQVDLCFHLFLFAVGWAAQHFAYHTISLELGLDDICSIAALLQGYPKYKTSVSQQDR